MSDQQTAYRQIFKATSIFGGVQIFNILIGVIKSKCAALFLGADGVGLFGLFSSTIDMVKSFTSLGVNTSAVREISEAASAGRGTQFIDRTILNVTRWYWLTAILGLIIVASLSPLLSKWTFENYDYVWSFIALSLMIFFMTLTAGQLSTMQGLRRISFIAKSSLFGNLTGLLFLIPLYYYFGKNGIVPFLVINSIIAFCFSMYFCRKMAIEKVDVTYRQSFYEGLRMVKLGFVLTISTTFALTIGYLIRLYIKDVGSLADVGYFTAAYAIAEGYMGIVFTAIVSDFYPRLSAINKDNLAMQSVINQQDEMLSLIVSPLLVLIILLSPIVLQILYSAEFISVSRLLQWYMLGMFVKATTVPIAYAMLSKGDTAVYLIKDLLAQIVLIITSVLGFKVWGLEGLGIAYLITHTVNFIIISCINYFNYNIVLNASYFKIFVPQLLIGITLFLFICFIHNNIVVYGVGTLLILLSILLSIRGLHSRMDLRGILTKLKKKIL